MVAEGAGEDNSDNDDVRQEATACVARGEAGRVSSGGGGGGGSSSGGERGAVVVVVEVVVVVVVEVVVVVVDGWGVARV